MNLAKNLNTGIIERIFINKLKFNAMNYKMLSLIVLVVLFLGVNQSKAQVEPLDCYVEIVAAVDNLVVAAEEVNITIPFCLTFQADMLDAIIDGTATLPCSADVILARMTIVVDKILADNGWPFCWPDVIPENVNDALLKLQELLKTGC